eukprot:scaffold113_cov339-Pavlova_lutheri.AAC.42
MKGKPWTAPCLASWFSARTRNTPLVLLVRDLRTRAAPRMAVRGDRPCPKERKGGSFFSPGGADSRDVVEEHTTEHVRIGAEGGAAEVEERGPRNTISAGEDAQMDLLRERGVPTAV